MTDRPSGQDKPNTSSNPAGNASTPKAIASHEAQFALEQTFPSAEALFHPYVVGTTSKTDVVVVLDTNALLLPYGIGAGDLSALEKVYNSLATENRLLIPGRVAREFIRHRDQKLADMVKALNDANSRITSPLDSLPSLLDGLEGHADLRAAIELLSNARKAYTKANSKIISGIRSWRGNDPVSTLYAQLFVKDRIVELDEALDDLSKEWNARLGQRTPPGYKDSAKADSGIGDFLIWKAILKVGAEKKRDLVFVTGEEKADWFVRSGGDPLYPRPELVVEYRSASSGKNLRLSKLADVLAEHQAPEEVVREVRDAEAKANNAVQTSSAALGLGAFNEFVLNEGPIQRGIGAVGQVLTVSTRLGPTTVRQGDRAVTLLFRKGVNDSIEFHRAPDVLWINWMRDTKPGTTLFFAKPPYQGGNRTTQFNLVVDDVFLAQSSSNNVLVGRILQVESDGLDDKHAAITFVASIFGGSGLMIVP